MISAREAHQQTVEAIDESDEIQKEAIEKAITEAIAAKQFNCRLSFYPNERIADWLRSLGYNASYTPDSGAYFMTISW